MALLLATLVAGLLTSCKEETALPILGERVFDSTTGRATDYRAPDFTLTTHRGHTLSEADVKSKVHLVSFFFTSCPTICPTMTKHLLLVEKACAGEGRLSILSHTIDPGRDTPERLRAYARDYGIDAPQWYFLTGERDQVFELSRGYKVQAFGGDDSGTDLFHDGTFVLLDGQRRIRGYYNGLDEADVEQLIRDIRLLLA